MFSIIVSFVVLVLFTGFSTSRRLKVVVIPIIIFNCFWYVAAGYTVNVINKDYGTNYSRAEVFYASNVIDVIQDLKRKRADVTEY